MYIHVCSMYVAHSHSHFQPAKTTLLCVCNPFSHALIVIFNLLKLLSCAHDVHTVQLAVMYNEYCTGGLFDTPK